MLLSVIMICTVVFSVPLGASALIDDETAALKEGTYEPGQVIVMFEDDTVKVQPEKGKKELASVGSSFGDSMESTSNGDTAFAISKSESDIIRTSLGDDFVIEDTVLFETGTQNDDGIIASTGANVENGVPVALVSSDKYDTGEMIRKLSSNDKIAYVEPNYYIEFYDIPDYSLNDTYARYLYQDNSPLAENTDGDNVSSRGLDPENVKSMNVSYAWDKVTKETDEVVVAVIDTGVGTRHEELHDMLWTNPGDIGLKGKHGYNFADNNTEEFDGKGHGTHCAGIIAAQANNNLGVAGVASKINVKIMALNLLGGKSEEPTLFAGIGAFSYVLKAKQRGVNVVATSNSWGIDGVDSYIYDDILNKLGEEGVLSFIAAGNSAKDIDRLATSPASTESEYAISVGASSVDGSPAPFTNYGKDRVDLFAPGVDILSSVGYECYFPNLYTPEKRSMTTDYYGVFDKDTVIDGKTVTPSLGDSNDDIKKFGSMVIKKTGPEGPEEVDMSKVEVELVDDHYFTLNDKSASLKLTIKGGVPGECYYVYFPYETSEDTADDDIDFSIYYTGTEGRAAIISGQVVLNDDGTCELTGGGVQGHGLNQTNYNIGTHIRNRHDGTAKVLDYDQVQGRQTGLGFAILPTAQEGETWREGETTDMVIYLDSLAVSQYQCGIVYQESYEMMSGTSMACPAAAGAGAVLASLYPREENESGADYSRRIRDRLFSCVTHTQTLENMCSTGGYIDFSLIDDQNPVINDAVCDVDKNTLTIYGERLTQDGKLSYKRLMLEDAADTELPQGDMTLEYAEDASSVVITNAKPLFGTYTGFTYVDKDGKKAKFSTYLVKGQNKLEKVLTEYDGNDNNDRYTDMRSLFTDAKGERLYSLNTMTGSVSYLSGNQFVKIPGTDLGDAVFDHLRKQGFDDYELYNDVKINMDDITDPLYDNNTVYRVVYVNINQGNDEWTEVEYLASLDVSEKEPKWTIDDFVSVRSTVLNTSIPLYLIYEGKLCALYEKLDDSKQSYLVSYDPAKMEWNEEAVLPRGLNSPLIRVFDGKIYVFFGVSDIENLPPDVYKSSEMSEVSDSVYCYDGEKFEEVAHTSFIGQHVMFLGNILFGSTAAYAKNGLIFMDLSLDGYGNVSLFNTQTNEFEPLYYTINDTNSYDSRGPYKSSCATKDGIYIYRSYKEESRSGWTLYRLPKDSGAYESYFGDGAILGDSDRDTKVTVIDVTTIQQYLVKAISEDAIDLDAADVDRNGKADIADATYIQRYLSNLDTVPGIGEPID